MAQIPMPERMLDFATPVQAVAADADTALPMSTASGTLPPESAAILRILGRNAFWLWIDLGALRIGTMVAGLFLIRYFGPVSFGVYSTAIAAGWIANAVVDLGLTRYAARAVSASASNARPVLALSLFATAVSVLLEFAALGIALYLGHWEAACLAGGFVLCNIEGTASLCSGILTADLRSKGILPGSILGAATLILAVIVVIWLHLSVLTMLLALCFKSLLVLCLRLWQLRSHWPMRADFHWDVFVRIAKDAFPFFSYNLTQVGYGRVAIVCFGLIAPPEQVGWFAAAFVLSDVIPQWSYASSGALLPVWTRLFESGRLEELLNLRQRLLDVLLFISIPLWITLALFAPDLCALLGSRYLPSAPVLRVVAYRSLLAVLDGFIGHGFLVAVNRVKERQMALSLCVALLAALSFVFGYLWGPVGVAVALFISDAVLLAQYLRIISKIEMKMEWPGAVPSLIAGAFMIICALLLSRQMLLPIRIFAVLLAYVIALILLSKDRLLGASRTLQECIR
jgi:O-antigen/teichoic acid export membrane protein